MMRRTAGEELVTRLAVNANCDFFPQKPHFNIELFEVRE
jgi:hypothetical protein